MIVIKNQLREIWEIKNRSKNENLNNIDEPALF